jgi:hypothetical protein
MDMKRTIGQFTTGAGRLVFPLSLNEPDTKFDDSEDKQKFKASLRLEGEDAVSMRGQVEEAWEGWLSTVKAALGKKPKVQAKNVQWFTADTKRWDDIGETTTKLLDELQEGEIIIKTTHKAFRDGVARRPKFFDAKGNGIPAEDLPPVGFGTVAKLHGAFYGWTTQANVVSLSLFFNAVQIIDLVEPGQGGGIEAEDFGFSATEGFVSEKDPFQAVSDDKGGDF